MGLPPSLLVYLLCNLSLIIFLSASTLKRGWEGGEGQESADSSLIFTGDKSKIISGLGTYFPKVDVYYFWKFERCLYCCLLSSQWSIPSPIAFTASSLTLLACWQDGGGDPWEVSNKIGTVLVYHLPAAYVLLKKVVGSVENYVSRSIYLKVKLRGTKGSPAVPTSQGFSWSKTF